MKKMWGGRFAQSTDDAVESFTESISFDYRLWRHDIRGSIAHVRMLSRQRIIPPADAKEIIRGLGIIREEIEEGRFVFRRDREDIHMNIEARLAELIGPVGGKLHTGRSRNDQVATDLRLYLREETRRMIARIRRLRKAFLRAAKKHVDTILPGYTHLQRAQPVRLAHHWLAYYEMLGRDAERFTDGLSRINRLPLGSAALAGTTFPLDRAYVARLLGFDEVLENSMDAVGDRDFVIEFLATAATTMMHLSRLAEELVLWTTGEFGFAELPDAFATGSSIMPQKKNPDVAELIRGKTGRVYGSLMALLTIMKGLPLAYNRDLQEDKEPVFDAIDTLGPALEITARIVPQLKFNKQRTREAAAGGYSTATDLADYLAARGVPFRQAHEIAGQAVALCIRKGCGLEELTLDEFRSLSERIDADIYDAVSLEGSVDRRTTRGGTGRERLVERIEQLLRRPDD